MGSSFTGGKGVGTGDVGEEWMNRAVRHREEKCRAAPRHQGLGGVGGVGVEAVLVVLRAFW